MSFELGLDPRAVSACAGVIRNASAEVGQVQEDCSLTMHKLLDSWVGADADQARRDWLMIERRLKASSRTLFHMSTVLDGQVHSQRRISGS